MKKNVKKKIEIIMIESYIKDWIYNYIVECEQEPEKARCFFYGYVKALEETGTISKNHYIQLNMMINREIEKYSCSYSYNEEEEENETEVFKNGTKKK